MRDFVINIYRRVYDERRRRRRYVKWVATKK